MMEQPQDPLESQIALARRSISSDGYQMSVGELTNLYKDGELTIRPEFQRLFRWSESQKSRLIESLLLGIPIPSIFVAQTESGGWELIDGLQRVSTILELQGELRDASGTKRPPLVLQATKYLSSLENRTWNNPDPHLSLSEAQRLDVKRSKIDVKIIKRESSPEAKFDMFQRLNSYGSNLTDQETRSALLVGVSPRFFSWMEELAGLPSFVASIGLSDRLIDERFDLELVTRFLILHARPQEQLTVSALRDLPQLLNNESVELAKAYPQGDAALREVFVKTFEFIGENGADKVFRRWDRRKLDFKGSFLLTSFEVFGLGVGYQFSKGLVPRDDLLERVKAFWSSPTMDGGFVTGQSTEKRLSEFVPFGRKILAPDAEPSTGGPNG